MIANALEDAIGKFQLDEVKTMNALQAAGLVSDNCVTARDVAAADCPGAAKAIESRHLNFVCCNYPTR